MRIELIHPLLVHFPLALLTIGTLLRALAIFYPAHLLRTSWIFLGIGEACAWMAVLAGEFAADIVAIGLCNRHLLFMHASYAYWAAYLFAGGLSLDLGYHYWPRLALHKIFPILCFILYLAAATTLVYVGALGAGLVYEQGAAVERCCNKP